ncbi:hypothetical protein [Nocardia sp. CDC160]|uniref:hypothetical protein n=1 Tax=Nocardia sp. CDC160 TaxID=3112166 RepID=UPI002DBD38C3|nr:hypothetical protein [Nocardia sp. CDC160]MEC3916239.1 hypothetical protein [Nocardia sp. CDC160]
MKTWLRYCGQLLLGLVVGAALTVICVFASAPLLFTSAVAIGPVAAFAVYLTIIAVAAIRNRGQSINHDVVRFLAGMAIVPLYGTVIFLDWVFSRR